MFYVTSEKKQRYPYVKRPQERSHSLTCIHLYCTPIRMVSTHLFWCNCRRRDYNGTIITRNQNTTLQEIKQKILLLPEVRAIQLHKWMISIISLTVLKGNTVFHAYCLCFLSPESGECDRWKAFPTYKLFGVSELTAVKHAAEVCPISFLRNVTGVIGSLYLKKDLIKSPAEISSWFSDR